MKGLNRILNIAQLRESDNFTIKQNNISSLRLMENAAHAFVNALLNKNLIGKRILVISGTGNNGGDGLAVCRILQNKGFKANAILVKIKEKLSTDCAINLERVQNVSILLPESELPNFSKTDIIIDALFGTGLNKPIKGFVAKLIKAINKSNKVIYSIDIPSGLKSDGISNSKKVIKSDHIISFQRPKLSFFLPENNLYINNWETVDIGLIEPFLQHQKSNKYILDESILKFIKIRHRQSHKGTYGHALLMAGSFGKIGAAILSAKACLRSGVGLLTTCVPNCGYEIMQTSVPEAMCITDQDYNILTQTTKLEHYNSIGIGPGIGIDNLTAKLLKKILKTCRASLVLDADALNILSYHQALLKHIPQKTIFTPHIKEFDRLVGPSNNSLERFKKQRIFSKKHKCIIVLKDAYTCISSSKGVLYFNTSGNQGMATGGSGDVLTGIITGLLAQKYKPLLAALIGVFIHGLAGDKAAKIKGYQGLIASDIIDQIKIETLKNNQFKY